jgi:hypothetical protein
MDPVDAQGEDVGNPSRGKADDHAHRLRRLSSPRSWINKGNGKVLPPIHLWEKPSGSDLILVAGRNRLEAHKRSEHWISARIIRGDSPEIVRAVKLCEIEENLNFRPPDIAEFQD